MRRVLIVVLLCLAAVSTDAAQGSPVYTATAAPSGACGSVQRVQIATDGRLYCCAGSGTWAACGGGTGYVLKAGDTMSGTLTVPALIVNNLSSGTNGITLNNNIRLDLGSGANDYIQSDGTKVVVAGGGTGTLVSGTVEGQVLKAYTANVGIDVTGRPADNGTSAGVDLGTMTAVNIARIACFLKGGAEKSCIDASGNFTGGIAARTVAPAVCDSTLAGRLYYQQGGAGVKDVVSICAKDAADAWAWRTIY